MSWLLVLVLAIIVVISAVLARIRAARRAGAIALWASRRGLTYQPGPQRDLARRFNEFKALSRGQDHVASNICHGVVDGREVWAFDDVYRAGNRGETGRVTAVLVKAEYPLIPLTIRRENALDRIGDAFGGGDIDFESAQFSDRFHVTSTDRKWAHDVIHPRMMEYLLAHAQLPLELAGWHVLVWGDRALAPAALDAALDLAGGLLTRIPDRVRRELLPEPVGAAGRRS